MRLTKNAIKANKLNQKQYQKAIRTQQKLTSNDRVIGAAQLLNNMPTGATSTQIIVFLLCVNVVAPPFLGALAEPLPKTVPANSSLPSGAVNNNTAIATQDHKGELDVSAASNNLGKTASLSTTALIKKKLKIYSGVEDLGKMRKRCGGLEEAIADAIKHEHDGHITKVLGNSKFKNIVCLDDVSMNQLPQNTAENPIRGLFAYGQDLMLFRAETKNPTPATIAHEFMHADAYYRHMQEPCALDTYKASVPVFPPTSEIIDQLNKAFDKGEKRILEFRSLWLKKKNGQSLSKNEEKRYKKFADACTECHEYTDERSVSEETYNTIAQALLVRKKSEVISVKISELDPDMSFGITGLRKKAGHYFAQISLDDPVNVVISLPQRIKDKLAVYKSQTLPDYKLLAEREAYTFQELTPKAAQFFYREANELRRKDIKDCASLLDEATLAFKV